MNNYSDYKKEVKQLSIQLRERTQTDKIEYINNIIELKRKHNIPPKEVATFHDLVCMITNVLETGESGTKTIHKYAKLENKTDKWRQETAQQRVNDDFKEALRQINDNKVILSMKENEVYNEHDIFNSSITGALRKLSKQLKLSRFIDELRNEISVLKNNLAAKVEGKDWKPEALRLKGSGMSIRQISQQLGAGKTTVGNFLKMQKE